MNPTRPLALSAALAVVCVVVGGLVAGRPGAVGAAVAAMVICLSFGGTAWLASVTRRLRPEAVMAVALASYGAKIMILGVVLVLLWDVSWLDPAVFAVTAMVVTAAWLAGTVWEATRGRTPVYDHTG